MKSNKNRVYILLILFLVVSYKTNFYIFHENHQSKTEIQNEDNKLNGVLKNNWVINGFAICTFVADQEDIKICSDGNGGAIIVWEDLRGVDQDIYAQKINSDGITQWMANGVAICTASEDQGAPQICRDGTGGAIIVWDDSRGDWDIYAQRVNATGSIQWTTNGTVICNASDTQNDVQICSDGIGGAIIVWDDYRGSWANDIYAQKINSSGSPQWTENGVGICSASLYQESPQICSDGAGGAIIVWEDDRDGNNDIYAQKISNSGSPQWTENGVGICSTSDYQWNPQICNDSIGGAIIVWDDDRGGGMDSKDIYAQKINSSGSPLWMDNGVVICSASEGQESPQICSDGVGGAIIVWEDDREYRDIYVQKINSSGSPQWTTNGVPICTASDSQYEPQICSDGDEGAIIVWEDERGDWDIYAQRVNATGSIQWTTNGTVICNANNLQFSPAICSDGDGGAIVSWRDLRNYLLDMDIYAQRILYNGTIPLSPLPPNQYNNYVVDNDDDNDDNEKGEQEAIIGYDLYIIAILSFGASIVTFFKIKKNFKNKLRKF